jgi:hypothetical protein
MRWLMICLLVSLAALLAAAAGMVRHVRQHHAKLRQMPRPKVSREAELEPWRKI